MNKIGQAVSFVIRLVGHRDRHGELIVSFVRFLEYS